MTVRLSPHKVTRLMRHYFGGIPQTKIAKRAGVDQSRVSIYASRFRDRAAKMGLLAAGKEFQVFNEVDELRSLSVELSKAKLTVDEAKEGLRIAKVFMKLGISPKQHTVLIRVCKEVNNSSFIHAAVKLSKIEDESNKSHQDIISRFEKVTSQLPTVEKQLQETQAELESVHKSLVHRSIWDTPALIPQPSTGKSPVKSIVGGMKACGAKLHNHAPPGHISSNCAVLPNL